MVIGASITATACAVQPPTTQPVPPSQRGRVTSRLIKAGLSDSSEGASRASIDCSVTPALYRTAAASAARTPKARGTRAVLPCCMSREPPVPRTGLRSDEDLSHKVCAGSATYSTRVSRSAELRLRPPDAVRRQRSRRERGHHRHRECETRAMSTPRVRDFHEDDL